MAIADSIRRIAEAYPPEAASVPSWERERYFTTDQQVAWLWRFERGDCLGSHTVADTPSAELLSVDRPRKRYRPTVTHTGGKS